MIAHMLTSCTYLTCSGFDDHVLFSFPGMGVGGLPLHQGRGVCACVCTHVHVSRLSTPQKFNDDCLCQCVPLPAPAGACLASNWSRNGQALWYDTILCILWMCVC